MYEFMDQPLGALGQGGRFLVWSMRSWLGAYNEGRCPSGAVGAAFVKWGVGDALPHFSMAMILLSRHATAPISIGPLPCRRVREGEALVLGLFRATGSMSADALRDTIALVVDGPSAAPLLAALAEVSTHLADAGLPLGAPMTVSGEAQ